VADLRGATHGHSSRRRRLLRNLLATVMDIDVAHRRGQLDEVVDFSDFGVSPSTMMSEHAQNINTETGCHEIFLDQPLYVLRAGMARETSSGIEIDALHLDHAPDGTVGRGSLRSLIFQDHDEFDDHHELGRLVPPLPTWSDGVEVEMPAKERLSSLDEGALHPNPIYQTPRTPPSRPCSRGVFEAKGSSPRSMWAPDGYQTTLRLGVAESSPGTHGGSTLLKPTRLALPDVEPFDDASSSDLSSLDSQPPPPPPLLQDPDTGDWLSRAKTFQAQEYASAKREAEFATRMFRQSVARNKEFVEMLDLNAKTDDWLESELEVARRETERIAAAIDSPEALRIAVARHSSAHK
jgi:hypothetical protein